MAYDPQANRRRPKPVDSEPIPVDALLDEDTPNNGADADPSNFDGPKPEEPPPGPGVTPNPADPVPDVVVASTGMAAGLGAGMILLLILRWFYKRSHGIGGEANDR